MNILDLLILVSCIGAIVRGVRLGLFRQIGSVVGFFAGILLGAVIVRSLLPQLDDATQKFALVIGVIVAAGILVGWAGEQLGIAVGRVMHRLHLGGLDALLGALLGGLMTILNFWLVAAMFSRVSIAPVSQLIADSRVLQAADTVLPPAPTVVTEVEQFFVTNGFPRVFIGLEPPPAAPVEVPSSPEVEAAVAADKASVLRIRGEGCGGLSFGSGFVIDRDLIMTNAHVVAGTTRITAQSGSDVYAATPILFDPNVDIALLKVSNLKYPALPLVDGTVSRGSKGAVLGYPGGGNFTAAPASVRQRIEAVGRNIYGRGQVERSVYEVQGAVEPGNSGGPLVLSDGRVIGVVFGKSVGQDSVAYALTVEQIRADIAQAAGRTQAVSTQRCVD